MNGCAPADELVPPFPAHDLREVSVLDAAYFQWAAAVLASGIERPLRPPSALLVARRAVPRNEWRTSMKRFEFKVNGETFFSETQVVDVADILRIAYTGKAIGKDPDKHGFRLNVANSPQSFVVGEQVDLEKFSVFRAFPDSGAPFSKKSDLDA